MGSFNELLILHRDAHHKSLKPQASSVNKIHAHAHTAIFSFPVTLYAEAVCGEEGVSELVHNNWILNWFSLRV